MMLEKLVLARAYVGNMLVNAQVMALTGASGEVVEEEKTASGGIDAGDLLSRTGAEAGDGPLAPIMDMTKDYGAAGYNITYTIFIYAAGIGILAGIIYMLFVSGNTQEASASKKSLIVKGVAVVVGFSVGSFIIFAQTIGGGLFQ